MSGVRVDSTHSPPATGHWHASKRENPASIGSANASVSRNDVYRIQHVQ